MKWYKHNAVQCKLNIGMIFKWFALKASCVCTVLTLLFLFAYWCRLHEWMPTNIISLKRLWFVFAPLWRFLLGIAITSCVYQLVTRTCFWQTPSETLSMSGSTFSFQCCTLAIRRQCTAPAACQKGKVKHLSQTSDLTSCLSRHWTPDQSDVDYFCLLLCCFIQNHPECHVFLL